VLEGYDFVYFSPGPWEGLRRNRHQLMSIFACQNKVIFVERRWHLRPTLAAFRRGELTVSDLHRPALRQISNGLFVYHYPMWAPISGRFPLSHLTKAIRRAAIRRALRRLCITQPIVWFSQPDMVDLIDEIPSARLCIYHVVDEYSAYSDHTTDSRRRVEEAEKKMLRLADVVIVVSEKLYEAKRRYNPRTYLIQNGVDYPAYTAALANPQVPPELEAIPRPRLGYSGLIGDKLDLDMLKDLALVNPQWSFVFIGQVRVVRQADHWQALLSLPNVHYLGLVNAMRVPHYLKGLDVGLMPYIQDRHAEHISPLKLYDYLAAGLPVASMNIPAAREFSQFVHLADRPVDFARVVENALNDVAPERRQARMNIAAQHTWEVRVEQLSSVIQAQMAGVPV